MSEPLDIWKQPIGWFAVWRTNTEVLLRRKRKMAAHRCISSALLVFLCVLSVFTVAQSQETTPPGGHGAAAADGPQTVTEVKEATPDESAAEEQEAPAADTAASAGPRPKDDFQEELVIRPLHSGDIYASFQFRTLWETDFTRENKGKLTANRDTRTCCSIWAIYQQVVY